MQYHPLTSFQSDGRYQQVYINLLVLKSKDCLVASLLEILEMTARTISYETINRVCITQKKSNIKEKILRIQMLMSILT
ncbi:MAG: hypothetical protein B1H12_04535 [Desulfobacteraceae bacterium 4484_190.2]|nr:MAG: hypothetical protein B1H12_04535 [Desulfobacteraceae bacterium 4484_190.2]